MLSKKIEIRKIGLWLGCTHPKKEKEKGLRKEK